MCLYVFVSVISRVSHSQQEGVPAVPSWVQVGRAGWLTGPEGCPAELGLRLGTFKLDESTNSHLPANSVSFFNP